MSIDRFHLDPDDAAFEQLANQVKTSLHNNDAAANLILNHHDNIPHYYHGALEALKYVLNSIRVTGFTVVENGTQVPVFQVYLSPPTTNDHFYRGWIDVVHSTSFVSIFSHGRVH